MDFREFYLDENPIKIDERSPCLNKTEFVGLPHLNQLRQIFNMRKISSDSNNSLSEFLVNQRRYFFKILKEKDSTDSIKSDDIQILKELDEFINLFTLTKKIEEFIKTDPLNKLRRYNTSSNVDSDFERFIVNEELQIVMHNFLSSIPETHVALDELRIKMNSDVTLAKPEILDILDEKKKFSCAQLQDLVDYVNTFDNEVKNYSDRDNYITKRYYFKKILNSVFTKQRKVYIDSILSPSNQNAMLNGLVSKNNILKNSKNYILLCGKRTTQIEREKDEIKAIKKTFKSEDMINYFNELLATKNKEIASINSNILSQCQTELNKFEIKVRKKINDIQLEIESFDTVFFNHVKCNYFMDGKFYEFHMLDEDTAILIYHWVIEDIKNEASFYLLNTGSKWLQVVLQRCLSATTARFSLLYPNHAGNFVFTKGEYVEDANIAIDLRLPGVTTCINTFNEGAFTLANKTPLQIVGARKTTINGRVGYRALNPDHPDNIPLEWSPDTLSARMIAAAEPISLKKSDDGDDNFSPIKVESGLKQEKISISLTSSSKKESDFFYINSDFRTEDEIIKIEKVGIYHDLLKNLILMNDYSTFLDEIKKCDLDILFQITWDEIKDEFDNSILHWISKTDSPQAIEILKYLIDNSVYFNFKLMRHNNSEIDGQKGKRPLAYAIENNNIEALKFILQIYKFEFLDIDGTGRSAIELALEKNSPEMVQLLSDHYYQFNEVCSKMIKAKEQEFLKWAVNNRNVKFIMTLLFQELDVNIVVSEGKNLLQWALDSNLEFQEKKELMSYLNSNYKVIEDTP